MEPIRYSVAACQTDQPNPIDRREMRRNTDRIAECARKNGIYVQTGSLLEQDPRWPGLVFNTTCLQGKAPFASRSDNVSSSRYSMTR